MKAEHHLRRKSIEIERNTPMSNKLLDDLTEKRRKVLGDQRGVIDAAFERPIEQRSLTSDERQKCDQMDGELSVLDARISDLLEGEDRALKSIEAVENTTRRPADP